MHDFNKNKLLYSLVKIDENELKNQVEIGSGGFGKVYSTCFKSMKTAQKKTRKPTTLPAKR